MLSLVTELKVEMVRSNCDIGTLAEELGMSRTLLSQKFNGHKDFKYEELQRIAERLQVPAWELIRRAEEAQTRKETA